MPIPQIHSINVVHQQNKQENIRHMLDLIQHMESVTNQVFDRISNRVSISRAKLNTIKERQARCQKMVEGVAGRTVVTTILSPARYPSYSDVGDKTDTSLPSASVKKHDILDSMPVFDRSEERRLVDQNEIRIHRIKASTETKRFVLDDPMPFFESKYANDAYRQQLIDQEIRRAPLNHLSMQLEDPEGKRPPRYGLGSYPRKLSSVSGLLLFNTNYDVHFAYQDDIDPTRGEEHDDLDEEQATNTGIDPPPESLVKGDDLPAFSVQSLSFRPTMKPLKTFGVPSQLDLPNVANTGEWAVADLETIAPSELIKSSDLGELPPPNIDNGLEGVAPPSSDLQPPSNLPPPSDLGAPSGLEPPGLAPPGLAPPDGNLAAPNNLGPPTGLSPPEGLGPPGDLAPPGQTQAGIQGELLPPSGGKTKPAAKPKNDRGAMLDAIRNFRKDNLKTAKAKKKKKDSQKKNSAPPSGADMQELLSKIMMRRKAIAGESKADDDDDDGDTRGQMDGERIGMPDEIPQSVKLQQKIAEEEDENEDKDNASWSDGSDDF